MEIQHGQRYDTPRYVSHHLLTNKGYGIARSPDEKVTPNTLFNIGSMTKAFISSAISLLVDDNHLPDVKWTTPVSQLIRDDFVLSDSRCTEMVTVEDMLSHRTGLPEYVYCSFDLWKQIST